MLFILFRYTFPVGFFSKIMKSSSNSFFYKKDSCSSFLDKNRSSPTKRGAAAKRKLPGHVSRSPYPRVGFGTCNQDVRCELLGSANRAVCRTWNGARGESGTSVSPRKRIDLGSRSFYGLLCFQFFWWVAAR